MDKKETRYFGEFGEKTDNLRRFLIRAATFSDCGRGGRRRRQLPTARRDARRQFIEGRIRLADWSTGRIRCSTGGGTDCTALICIESSLARGAGNHWDGRDRITQYVSGGIGCRREKREFISALDSRSHDRIDQVGRRGRWIWTPRVRAEIRNCVRKPAICHRVHDRCGV